MLRRMAPPMLRFLSTRPPPPSPPRLWDKVSITEGRSWVCMVPRNVRQHPRVRSKHLRWAGNARAAHQVLRAAGVQRSPDEADLIEFLLVLLETDEFKGPRERLEAMVDVLWSAPTVKSKPAFNILLTACVRESARVSDNSSVKVDVVLKTARTVWEEMIEVLNSVDPRSTASMYRICGNCKDLELARRVRSHTNDPALPTTAGGRRGHVDRSTEEATAAFILCLGQCGRPLEAEQHYFSRHNWPHMSSDNVLSALFQAYVVSNRMSKAEALIAMYGSNFLNVQSCNAFIKQCVVLRLFESAVDFMRRMSRAEETGFPKPNAGTYNLLLRGISAGTGSEDRETAADRALQIVEEMKRQGIKPTTVTYNTLIRSFVFRNHVDEAFDLYRTMDSPNRITFSHLMQGAANVGDLELAEKVFSYLARAEERPNYGFCKSYLEVVARKEGVSTAFAEAMRISEEFGDVVVFEDVASHEVVRMALISACGKVGNLQKAFEALDLDLVSHSKRVGRLAALYVATVLMQVCLECAAPGRALEVFYSLKSAGLQPNFEVYESLIYGLCSLVRASTVHNQQMDSAHEDADIESEAPGDLGSSERGEGLHTLGGADENNDYYDDSNVELERQSGGRLPHSQMLPRRNWLGSALACDDALRIAVELLCEMHECGHARAVRQAAYVYNTLIAAAAAVGDFELALQVFNKMSKRNNPSVVYFSKESDPGWLQKRRSAHNTGFPPTTSPSSTACTDPPPENDRPGLATLVSTGMFENQFEFPEATVGTYNSMIDAAANCGETKFSFELFDLMQMDRNTEPNAATLSLLSDIALLSAQPVSIDAQHKLLRELDRNKFLPHDVCQKRVRLRQKLVAMRWT